MLDWLRFFALLLRDHLYDQLGYYPFDASQFPTRYVWGQGLALGCDVTPHPRFLMYQRKSLLDLDVYRKIRQDDLVWVHTDCLPDFVRKVLPAVEARFTLVTTCSDWTVPRDCPHESAVLVESGKLRRWYAINYDRSDYTDLIRGIPIGLNYPIKNDYTYSEKTRLHGMLRTDMLSHREQQDAWDRVVDDSPPRERRRLEAVGDFYFSNTSRSGRYGETRADIRGQLERNPAVYFPPRVVPQARLIEEYSRYAAVISPHGRGLDCFRTWEALLAGCIAVVKRSPLDPLYAGLPVAIIDDWREVTPGNLRDWIDQFAALDVAAVRERLSHRYWMDLIREDTASPA